MRLSRLNIAIEEAERFLKKAKEVRKQVKFTNDVVDGLSTPSMQVAACKRSSLDLTRALAVLRRADDEV